MSPLLGCSQFWCAPEPSFFPQPDTVGLVPLARTLCQPYYFSATSIFVFIFKFNVALWYGKKESQSLILEGCLISLFSKEPKSPSYACNNVTSQNSPSTNPMIYNNKHLFSLYRVDESLAELGSRLPVGFGPTLYLHSLLELGSEDFYSLTFITNLTSGTEKF